MLINSLENTEECLSAWCVRTIPQVVASEDVIKTWKFRHNSPWESCATPLIEFTSGTSTNTVLNVKSQISSSHCKYLIDIVSFTQIPKQWIRHVRRSTVHIKIIKYIFVVFFKQTCQFLHFDVGEQFIYHFVQLLEEGWKDDEINVDRIWFSASLSSETICHP